MKECKIEVINQFFDNAVNLLTIKLPFGYQIIVRRMIKVNYKWNDKYEPVQ